MSLGDKNRSAWLKRLLHPLSRAIRNQYRERKEILFKFVINLMLLAFLWDVICWHQAVAKRKMIFSLRVFKKKLKYFINFSLVLNSTRRFLNVRFLFVIFSNLLNSFRVNPSPYSRTSFLLGWNKIFEAKLKIEEINLLLM